MSQWVKLHDVEIIWGLVSWFFEMETLVWVAYTGTWWCWWRRNWRSEMENVARPFLVARRWISRSIFDRVWHVKKNMAVDEMDDMEKMALQCHVSGRNWAFHVMEWQLNPGSTIQYCATLTSLQYFPTTSLSKNFLLIVYHGNTHSTMILPTDVIQ